MRQEALHLLNAITDCNDVMTLLILFTQTCFIYSNLFFWCNCRCNQYFVLAPLEVEHCARNISLDILIVVHCIDCYPTCDLYWNCYCYPACCNLNSLGSTPGDIVGMHVEMH